MNSRLLAKTMLGRRLVYIDVLKSIAILFMIEVHTSAILAPSNIPKSSFIALIAASIGGLAAPLFVTMSGWSAQHSLKNKQGKKTSNSSIYYWLLCRFTFLFICQFIVNITANHVFHWNSPGILSLLAICTLISFPLSKIKIKTKLIILILILITPISNNYLFELNGNWDSLIYVNSLSDFILKIFFNGTYPLFPWLSFFILGGILRESEKNVNYKLFLCGLTCSISFMIFSVITGKYWALTQGDAVLTFFPPSTGFIVTANSTVLIMYILFKKYNHKFESNPWVLSFTKIGKITLTIYLLHFIPLRFLSYYDQSEWEFTYILIITLIYTFLWWPLSIIHDKYFSKFSLETLLRYILAKKNIQSTTVRDS
tara:strand:- start:2780 stop:3889 length:1110 start_codon:yes stop_codon:yes gene_type:complete